MTFSKLWILFCFLLPLACQSQNHSNQWFFGNHAGVNFNSGIPVATSQGMQNTFEGGSSYCDHNGNLLFYSDGLTVWNKNHQVMANGTGLLGGQSSTTSALVVRQPSNCDLYYLFTVQDHLSGAKSFRYSVINMALNGGLGGVVLGMKNVLIANSCAEKIVAIRHQNGVDSWIVTHYLGNANFAAYRLSSTGLNTVPVISTTGSVHGANCMIGFLKSNHAGNLLVSAQMFCSRVEMFDFNRGTGMVSNPRTLLNNLNGVYGAEFSPNDQILYLSKGFSGCELYQVNPFNVSSTYLVSAIPGDYNYGGLQMGPNGKIYMARNATSFLGVVNSPNTWGAGCGFVPNGFPLAPGTGSGFGIVSFATDQSISYAPGGYQIATNDTCYGSPSTFTGLGIIEYDSIVWNFGDPSSGSFNHSTGLNTGHYYTSAGTFLVTMIVYGCEPDTITVPVNVLPCILPMNLELYAVPQGSHILVTWEANDEGEYSLERSLDGQRFQPCHSFRWHSNLVERSYLDVSIKPEQKYYYRIRHVNSEGITRLSKVVEASAPSRISNECRLSPSISSKEGQIHLECPASHRLLELEILDLNGRLIDLDGAVGSSNWIVDLGKTSIGDGLYFMRIRHDQGQSVLRLVIR